MPSSDFSRRVARDIAAHSLLAPGSCVVVGLSGGADSVALFLVLLRLGYHVEAAHCNFHLRGAESNRDAAFVTDLCARYGVPLHRADFETARSARLAGVSIEMQARDERYAFFESVRRQTGAVAIAVAHHRDDNVETLLLNLVRGAGLRGLHGMAWRNGHVVRPMLGVTRSDVENFLRAEGETFVTDSTNTDTAIRRNLIRHEVLPLLRRLNPSVDATLDATARRLAEADELCRYALDHVRRKVCTPLPDGEVIDAAALLHLPAARSLLFELLRPYGFAPGVCGEIFDGLSGPPGALYDAGDWLAVRGRSTVEVRRRPVRFDAVPLADGDAAPLPDGRRLRMQRLSMAALGVVPRVPSVAALDAASIEGPLVCRSVRRGDRFTPLGMRGSRLVSDYLTDRKRSRIDKMAATAVCDARGIVWLVGERPDERCRVTEATTEVVLLEIG